MVPTPDHPDGWRYRMDRQSQTWLLLEAAHRRLNLERRFTAVEAARRAEISEDKARRIFKGANQAAADRGELPSEQIIAAIAHAYRISPRVLRDALIRDAGRDDNDAPEVLESAASFLLEQARRLREHDMPDSDPGHGDPPS